MKNKLFKVKECYLPQTLTLFSFHTSLNKKSAECDIYISKWFSFFTAEKEKKNLHERSIGTSLFQTWESEPVCICMCEKRELKWVDFLETVNEKLVKFSSSRKLSSHFFPLLFPCCNAPVSASSQSSTYDNRTAQTCASSQCRLPLLHTSPNLRLSLSCSHSSSLPPSPCAFVLRDRAILTRRVTIVAESIFQTSTANCHFSWILSRYKKGNQSHRESLANASWSPQQKPQRKPRIGIVLLFLQLDLEHIHSCYKLTSVQMICFLLKNTSRWTVLWLYLILTE